ncbi:MAG: molybdopterin-dependent oxidoreductase [Bryobacterales bacterium]|nr:molybdopterin-dependent oxidoreductase [Bryobacterales bacterium]MBV9397243.1 molybdopterin-dependent oxidoreductase [Bryobacterales bacterium]
MSTPNNTSRRQFLERSGAAIVAATAAPALEAQAPSQNAQNTISPDPSVPRTTIKVTINGSPRRIEVEDRWTLVELLRDHLGLTGTRIGCDRGECGACTVLIDGKAGYSCSQLAVWMDGRSIQTVESLAQNGNLDPLQKAFIEHDAPQCGFCTSGQLMSAKGLLNRNPKPAQDDARAALTGNICRCSNYNRYVEATLAAAGVSSPQTVQRFAAAGAPFAALKTIGHETPRIDARERVTGKATYSGDVRLPGMLYAKVLRSPHAHARIKSIDISKAQALPGVKAVLTHDNCTVVWGAGGIAGGQQYNDAVKKITKQRRYAFNNPVRFVGDPVAAVAAVNRHVAEEALQLISVDYEVLPHVLEPEEALKPGAPQIWPEGNLALDTRNEAKPTGQRRGDVEKGFQEAMADGGHVFEDRLTTTLVHNAQMEPRSCVAHWEGEKLTVYTPTGGIANCRADTARDLDVPLENVRIVCQYMGGNFGNKNQNQDSDLIAAMLAKQSGAPVKVEYSRKEDFIGMHGRWPTVQYYKVGVSRDGTLKSIQLRGYSGMGGYRKNSGNIGGIEVYQCPNIETTIYPVYTNKTTSGNFRGPEYPQGYFGIQNMMDEVAFKLNMDPVEFALKNMTRKANDQNPYTNYTLDECIHRGAEAFGWKQKWRPEPGSDRGPVKRGAGFAFMAFRSGVGRSNAIIELDSSGKYIVRVGVTDVGAGAKTTMGLIAAEALEVPLSQVTVDWGDTSRCPYSVGESGSRTTIQTGYAVVEAAREIKKQIAEKGMPKTGERYTASTNPNPTIADNKVRATYGAHFVEVEVDVETGRARVLKYLAVHDCGRVMNPLTAASQIKGGAIMGIGMALHEELLYDARSGQPLTAGYYGHRVLTHRDAPDIEVIFIESDDGYGPWGAKSMGESSKVPAVAAVGNAVFNALGHRMRDLPITRDKILMAAQRGAEVRA